MRIRLMAGWCAVVATVSAAGLTPPASAQQNPAGARAATLLTPGAEIYAGYGAVAASFRVLAARWTMPAVTCPPAGLLGGVVDGAISTVLTGGSVLRVPGLLANPTDALVTLVYPHLAPWIGLIGMGPGGDRTLVQTGTDVVCDHGVPQYGAFFVTPSFGDQDGVPIPDDGAPGTRWSTPPTTPGDAIAATVDWDGDGAYRLAVADTTRGWHYGATFRSSVVPTGAVAVVESIPYNVPGFTPVAFTGVTADGRPFGDYRPRALTIAPRLGPTPLSGDSFAVVPG
jgi:hypothetical protein